MTPDEIALINPAIDAGRGSRRIVLSNRRIHPAARHPQRLSRAARGWASTSRGARRPSMRNGAPTDASPRSSRPAGGSSPTSVDQRRRRMGRCARIGLGLTFLLRRSDARSPSPQSTRPLPDSMPMTIFTDDGFHLRVRDGRVLLLWPTPGLPGRPFDATVDAEWIDAVTAKAHARIPALRNVRSIVMVPGPDCTRCHLTSTPSSAGIRSARTCS